MSAARRPETYFTEREYFEYEQTFHAKHEYYQGGIFAMTGASPRHNDITGNTFGALRTQLRGNSCIPRVSDQRLRIESADLTTYPDVLVACPPLRYSPNDSYALLDATVIIEVLSPSTSVYDKGTKFDFYRELPSLRHYVLIEQEHVEVEHRWIDSQRGEWQSQVFTDLQDAVRLSAIDCSLSVAELYERVEF